MHPNIVPIHLVESHDDIAFFVMGLVDGETLAERVSRAGALPVAEALRVMQEVAWALAMRTDGESFTVTSSRRTC